MSQHRIIAENTSNIHNKGWYIELVCQECKDKYIGETSRSAYSRGKEHLHSLNRREEQSVMWRHACEKHGGDIPSFVMNVTGIFRDDAMLKQITEAVLIGKVKPQRVSLTLSINWRP